MTLLASQYAATHRTFSDRDQRSHVSKKVKVFFEQLICPANGSVAFGLTTAQAFEIFRWMVRSSDPFREYGRPGPWDCLSLKSTCINHSAVEPFVDDWRKDLRARFLNAVLCPFAGAATLKWRKACGVVLGTPKIVPIRHYAPTWTGGPVCDFDLAKSIDRLFSFRNRKLIESHNECHPKARTVHFSRLVPGPQGWTVVAHYGYATDRASWWMLDIATQGESEVFDDFILRAVESFESKVTVEQ